jgi:peptidoglycan/xylan/chitin deacetylase (PgdA/CDA1 family)
MINRLRLPETISPAHGAGFTAFFLSGLLLFIQIEMAAVPLALFVLFCLAAPFIPQAGFFLPVISRGKVKGKAVALTFDDGPDPDVTSRLLDLLRQYEVPATFFLVGKNAERHPELVREILLQGHSIGNHSYHHDPLLMIRSEARLSEEIGRVQEVMAHFGVRPLAFRPPVGITNPKLPKVLRKLNIYCVTFSCRASDFGNRRMTGLAKRILQKIHPGAVILLHDITPPGEDKITDWLDHVKEIILGLKSRGYDIVPLSQLIAKPVMEPLPIGSAEPSCFCNCNRLFDEEKIKKQEERG